MHLSFSLHVSLRSQDKHRNQFAPCSFLLGCLHQGPWTYPLRPCYSRHLEGIWSVVPSHSLHPQPQGGVRADRGSAKVCMWQTPSGGTFIEKAQADCLPFSAGSEMNATSASQGPLLARPSLSRRAPERGSPQELVAAPCLPLLRSISQPNLTWKGGNNPKYLIYFKVFKSKGQ